MPKGTKRNTPPRKVNKEASLCAGKKITKKKDKKKKNTTKKPGFQNLRRGRLSFKGKEIRSSYPGGSTIRQGGRIEAREICVRKVILPALEG